MSPRFLARALAVVTVAALAGGAFAYCRRPPDPSPALARATAAVVVADSARASAGRAVAQLAPATERARVRQRRAAAAVVVLDDSTLAVQHTPSSLPVTVAVPPPIVERIRADSVLIDRLERENAALRQLVAIDTGAIGARDTKIRVLEAERAPRCGMWCGVVIGVAGAVLTGGAIAWWLW